MANKNNWKAKGFLRMWPRGLFHMKRGMTVLRKHLNNPGVYVLYRDDRPYYIGKTGKTLLKRLKQHALRPNARRYNFWNYFSAFEIDDPSHRDEVEAILISAMPTANSSNPKLVRKRLDRDTARLLNDIQALMLTGQNDTSGISDPEEDDEDDDATPVKAR